MLERKPHHKQLKSVRFKVTRPRVGSRRALKDKLDRVFSLYIRLRDGACVICKSTQDLECSHYHGRSNPESRVDPLNSHAMCKLHNQLHNSDRTIYTRFLIKRYGEDALRELNERMIRHRKLTDEEIKEQIAEYEMLIEVLRSDIEAAA